MQNWQVLCVKPGDTVRTALGVIDRGAKQIALVVDDDGRLVGTLTDGDVRRSLLAGRSLETAVRDSMNPRPHTLQESDTPERAMATLRALELRHLPRVAADGKLLGLTTLEELALPRELPNAVVLMAGGMGQRLFPLTREVPKPLLPIGNRPILEIIVDQLARQGFRRFFISVNYKAEMIEGYFGDGSRLGVRVEYLRENTRLGTAGALGLLPAGEHQPLLVMNGDLLTRLDFKQLVDFHEARGAMATMALTRHDITCPYGVVHTKGDAIVGMEEKPTQSFVINGGIYVLRPDALAALKPGEALDMPDLFRRLMESGKPCMGYTIQDYWMDIGRMDDLERARAEFG